MQDILLTRLRKILKSFFLVNNRTNIKKKKNESEVLFVLNVMLSLINIFLNSEEKGIYQ